MGASRKNCWVWLLEATQPTTLLHRTRHRLEREEISNAFEPKTHKQNHRNVVLRCLASEKAHMAMPLTTNVMPLHNFDHYTCVPPTFHLRSAYVPYAPLALHRNDASTRQLEWHESTQTSEHKKGSATKHNDPWMAPWQSTPSSRVLSI